MIEKLPVWHHEKDDTIDPANILPFTKELVYAADHKPISGYIDKFTQV